MEGIEFEAVTRGAVKCSEVEAALNPRSRSAKLRVIMRREEAL
jgi:16S rRNA C1402 N4-methylase RsmH